MTQKTAFAFLAICHSVAVAFPTHPSSALAGKNTELFRFISTHQEQDRSHVTSRQR